MPHPQRRRRSRKRSTSAAHSSPRCEQCRALLPRELFGLGRCPCCVDYDGAGEALLTAALDSLWRGDSGVERVFAYRRLASHLGIASAKTPTFAAIDAVLALRLWPSRFTRDEDAWRHYEAKESNFRTWKRLVPHLPDATMRHRYQAASAPLTRLEREEVAAGLAAMLLAANLERHAALKRSLARLANLCARHCRLCGALLPDPHIPAELSGLGRCPCCVDYDGPGRFSAAKRSLPELEPMTHCPRALPRACTRLKGQRKLLYLWLRRHSSRSHSSRAAAASHARVQHPPPARVPVVVVGGQRFAAPLQRERRVSKRKLAMMEFAHTRAIALASQNATPQQVEQLQAAVLATHELAEYGAAQRHFGQGRPCLGVLGALLQAVRVGPCHLPGVCAHAPT